MNFVDVVVCGVIFVEGEDGNGIFIVFVLIIVVFVKL